MEALSLSKNIRIMPNGFARSNLFSVSDTRATRKYVDNIQISSPKGITLYYKGEELRQDDADVFLALIFLLNAPYSKKENMSTETTFSAKQIFALMGWPYRNFYISKLKSCLDRMKEGTFRYHEKLGMTAISLLSYVHYPLHKSDKSQYVIQVSNDLFRIYDNNFTKINIHIRNELTPMARWLYSFYASHTEPFPLKSETLKEYSGSTCKDIKNFRAIVKSALQELVDIKFLHSFFLEKKADLVHVRRNDILKNSKDPYFSDDLLNIIHVYIESTQDLNLDIQKIRDVCHKVDCIIEDDEKFLKMICRCLDELIKHKKINSYILNKNNTISVFRHRKERS